MTPDFPKVRPETLAFLHRQPAMFINGNRDAAVAGGTRVIHDPGRGVELARVADGDGADVDRAVAAARKAFEGPWRTMKPNQRSKVLWRFADLTEEHADVLAELEALNIGLPLAGLKAGHIAGSVDLLRYTAGWPTKLVGKTIPVSSPGEWHAYTQRDPVGVVAQIVPWNGPIMMAVWKIAPALAAGCTVVLKPSELTPLTALYLAELALEAGMPEGVLNVVLGGSVVGEALARHMDVDKIAFTGSTNVGRQIATAAA